MKAPVRSKPLQIYLKPGIREEDLLLDVWEACGPKRRQEVFRGILRRGLLAALEAGEIPEQVIEEARLKPVIEKAEKRRRAAAPAAPVPVPAYPPQYYPQQFYPQPYPAQPPMQPPQWAWERPPESHADERYERAVEPQRERPRAIHQEEPPRDPQRQSEDHVVPALPEQRAPERTPAPPERVERVAPAEAGPDNQEPANVPGERPKRRLGALM